MWHLPPHWCYWAADITLWNFHLHVRLVLATSLITPVWNFIFAVNSWFCLHSFCLSFLLLKKPFQLLIILYKPWNLKYISLKILTIIIIKSPKVVSLYGVIQPLCNISKNDLMKYCPLIQSQEIVIISATVVNLTVLLYGNWQIEANLFFNIDTAVLFFSKSRSN